MSENKNPLRQIGVYQVKVVEVKKTEYKGKSKAVVVFHEEKSDRWIDAVFNLPPTDITKKQIAKLIECCGGEPGKFPSIQGKECLIVVAPNAYKGKTFWNVVKFLSKEWIPTFNGTVPELGDEPFGLGASPAPTDDDYFGTKEASATGDESLGF
jgi:hypothetical protein